MLASPRVTWTYLEVRKFDIRDIFCVMLRSSLKLEVPERRSSKAPERDGSGDFLVWRLRVLKCYGERSSEAWSPEVLKRWSDVAY
jgi:hypothetical protein